MIREFSFKIMLDAIDISISDLEDSLFDVGLGDCLIHRSSCVYYITVDREGTSLHSTIKEAQAAIKASILDLKILGVMM